MLDLHIKGEKVLISYNVCMYYCVKRTYIDVPHNTKAMSFALLLCGLSSCALQNNACKHNKVSTYVLLMCKSYT